MMEKFWGTKEATGSVWRCVEQTGPPLSLNPWSGGLATLILPSFLSLPPLPLYMNWFPHSPFSLWSPAEKT